VGGRAPEPVASPRFEIRRDGIFLVAIVFLVASWLALFGSYGWAIVLRYCAEHYDFGIYTQAIAGFSLHDLNPWLSARGLHIFNDHFDPIVLAALLFRPFFSPSISALFAEQGFVLASLIPVAWLWKKRDIGRVEAFTVSGLVLFSAGTVDAVLFPVHPTTWTLFPAMLLAAAWVRRSDAVVLVALALLFACKEEHVLCGPFVAYALWTTGRSRAAWGALVLTVVWGTFVFVLRPMLLGPAVPYLEQTLLALRREPGAALITSARATEFRRLGTLLVPFIPLTLWAARAYRPVAWGIVLATLPLLMSRFLAVKWGYQYGPPLVGLWVAGFVPALASVRLPRWVALFTFILLLTSLENPLRNAIHRLRPSTPSVCFKDPQRLEAIDRGLAYLREHVTGAALVTSTFVAPLADRPEIYSLGSSQRLSNSHCRYLFVEKPPYGYDWPLSAAEVSKMLEGYRGRKDTRIIFETQYVLLAEGNF
jgi:uncharacterized membrane protein